MSDDETWASPEPAPPPPGWSANQPPPYAPRQHPAPPPPPRYGYRPPPQAQRPGIIHLRPLTLGDILDGTIKLIRLNPRATLGISAVVTSISQLLVLVIQFVIFQRLFEDFENAITNPNAPQSPVPVELQLINLLAGVVQAVILVLLTGLLTAVIGKAIFGQKISAGEAWRLARPRIPALLGVTGISFLLVFGFVAIILVPVVLLDAVAGPGAALAGALIGLLAGTPLVVFLWTKMSLAAPAIVLERIGVFAGIRRSFALVKGDFWRVFGILILTALLVGLVAGTLAVPFTIAGFALMLIDVVNDGTFGVQSMIGLVLIAIGGIVSGTVGNPITAGVNAVLYVDRRMRAEAFDLVLQAEALEGSSAGDDVWDPARNASPTSEIASSGSTPPSL